MKILVPVKRVIDPYVKIRIKPTEDGVETAHVKHAMNPFDEIAIEEALRFVEKQLAEEVIAVTIGTHESEETLRHALALGAHRGILIESEADVIYPSLHIAKILQSIVQQEKPDLVLMGKQAIDGDNNQTPQMLAALLDWPQATFASLLEMDKAATHQLKVTREVDAGLETLMVTLPAVVSTDLRLNEPRYASLPNIMKAKQKPIHKMALSALNLDLMPHLLRLSVKAPAMRKAGIRVTSVDELLDKLRHEARVIE